MPQWLLRHVGGMQKEVKVCRIKDKNSLTNKKRLMKHSILFFSSLVGCTLLTSCFKDEPLNAECDIEKAFVHQDTPEDVFPQITDTLVNVMSDATDIMFNIKPSADVSKMAPQFVLTPGATISPESGTEFDFSDGKKVQYVVTSQDKSWSRTYNVSFGMSEMPTSFHFENVENFTVNEVPKYHVWYDLSANGKKLYTWATGNAGYKIPFENAKPEEYPSVSVDDGNGPLAQKSGKYVKLTTRSTGSFGAMVNRRLAAGNLFIGTFDVSKALSNTLLTTRFGLPFSKRPLRFTGWYKYAAGPDFQVKNGSIVPGRIDKAAIYAVMYKNHDADGNSFVLNGYDVKTNSNIVAIADLGEIGDTPQWTHFDVAFNFSAPINDALLQQNGYSIAIVASSSVMGDQFEGAVGSTLCVDEFELVCE